MEFLALGKTGLLVSRTAFGAMSLDCQRIQSLGDQAEQQCCAMVRKAYIAGINLFDVSHTKPLCEKRLGFALGGIRENVIICSKSVAQCVSDLRTDIDESLINLDTGWIDIYMLDGLNQVPTDSSPDKLYNEISRYKHNGVIKYIGYATEDCDMAREAVLSGLYDVIQLPFNMLTNKATEDVVKLCYERQVGCIASQPMCKGLISSAPLALGFFLQYENVSPVWGVQSLEEIDNIIYLNNHPPRIDQQFLDDIAQERALFE